MIANISVTLGLFKLLAVRNSGLDTHRKRGEVCVSEPAGREHPPAPSMSWDGGSCAHSWAPAHGNPTWREPAGSPKAPTCRDRQVKPSCLLALSESQGRAGVSWEPQRLSPTASKHLLSIHSCGESPWEVFILLSKQTRSQLSELSTA